MKVTTYYSIDEFNGNQKYNDELPTSVLVEKKVNLLYDFHILKKRKGRWGRTMPDSREDAVREMLSKCVTERTMNAKLHDVLRKERSLDEILKKGV